jgi:hypothetical protein
MAPRAESHAADVKIRSLCRLLVIGKFQQKLLIKNLLARPSPAASLHHHIWLLIFGENVCVMLASNLRNTMLSPRAKISSKT